MIGRSQLLGERIMAFQDELTTSEIATVFADEIAARRQHFRQVPTTAQGSSSCAVLRQEREVQPRDRVQGGVAFRAIQEEVSIHPYVFRQVCQNGAIIAQSVETRLIDRTDFTYDPDAEAVLVLRESIRECCEPEVFENVATAMRARSIGRSISPSTSSRCSRAGRLASVPRSSAGSSMSFSRPSAARGST